MALRVEYNRQKDLMSKYKERWEKLKESAKKRRAQPNQVKHQAITHFLYRPFRFWHTFAHVENYSFFLSFFHNRMVNKLRIQKLHFV